MSKPTIIVSGLTRCGSSMMMQMLYAGGLPVSCEPGNELISGEHSDQLSALREIALGLTEGKAIKCLDVHNFPLPPNKEYVIIWMRRNYTEQSKSIAKFMQMLLGVRESKRILARRFEKSLPHESRKCHSILADHPLIEVRFEDVINNPKGESELVAKFIDDWGKLKIKLDADKMASVVIKRSTDCYSGMMEAQLIKDRCK